ncbi:ATP phosphoribosyltransferase regulatory subunit [Syntrophomonas palmitatica]|uniref:ATP phosphoribosyltransferase regulatory subunit n=1 Tax=Syntrophomonas palmitatica TaxID=402877 RepID=UPI0006D27F0B|nr:ATP phosphoribosyltransferase regulatory subunit [Syntrophomonas palmitatica]
MRNREVPKGTRDLLPDEVKIKRLIEKKAERLFTSCGYSEVTTPSFEFLEVVETGTGRNMREELFLFMDREGGILSLRPEMTLSIARLAATHLREAAFPQRLFYMANVFRHVQPHLAQYREFWQLGIELLGAPGQKADAEVISIAVKTLREIGLRDFKVSLNHIGIFNSLLNCSSLQPEEKSLTRSLIEGKDLVALSAFLENAPMEDILKETLASLPVLHGGIEVLQKLPYLEQNREANKSVQELLEVYELLKVCGVIDNIVIDMGVLRGLDYYTGMVFEGYSPDLGYGLLGGGRYDNLMGQFGFPLPATGFALGLDRLALVLKQREEETQRFLVGGTDFSAVLTRAEELRAAGYIAELDVEGLSREELEAKGTSRPNCRAIYVE